MWSYRISQLLIIIIRTNWFTSRIVNEFEINNKLNNGLTNKTYYGLTNILCRYCNDRIPENTDYEICVSHDFHPTTIVQIFFINTRVVYIIRLISFLNTFFFLRSIGHIQYSRTKQQTCTKFVYGLNLFKKTHTHSFTSLLNVNWLNFTVFFHWTGGKCYDTLINHCENIEINKINYCVFYRKSSKLSKCVRNENPRACYTTTVLVHYIYFR